MTRLEEVTACLTCGEYVNPEGTKLSSPLMFSRSSSVGSLNSCEQQSIDDDRSFVSVFSNLQSGSISPSEIPDSPCGMDLPFTSKTKTENEFLFPENDQTIMLQAYFTIEPFGNVDAVKVFNDEGDCDDIKEDLTKSDDDSDIDESDLLVQQCIQLGRSELRNPKGPAETKLCAFPSSNKALGSRDNWPDGVSDGEDDDDDILSEIIQAGKPGSNSQSNNSPYAQSNKPCLKPQSQRKLTAAEDRALYLNKDFSNIIPNYGNMIPKEIVRTECASANTLIGIDDSMYVFRTEDTPILSPSASLSDLSTLSFTEDKVYQESFLNNSRNSDCSSDSEDDEMLLQCIRQGMPGGRRVVA